MTGAGEDPRARRLLAAHDDGRPTAPLTDTDPGLTLDAGYDIAAGIHALRLARGERPVGRKIGFTNRTIWPIYGVHGPLWGWVYDTTLHALPTDGTPIPLPRLNEPRLEPEIAFRLDRAPVPGMDDAELAACIGGVAHGFELVFSPYPGWRFRAADCSAAFGLHGALLLGPWHDPAPFLADAGAPLAGLSITLTGPETKLTGRGDHVLGGPLQALRFLLDELARTDAPALGAGEIVTTGTLTDAVPVAPGQTWETAIDGVALPGQGVAFATA